MKLIVFLFLISSTVYGSARTDLIETLEELQDHLLKKDYRYKISHLDGAITNKYYCNKIH